MRSFIVLFFLMIFCLNSNSFAENSGSILYDLNFQFGMGKFKNNSIKDYLSENRDLSEEEAGISYLDKSGSSSIVTWKLSTEYRVLGFYDKFGVGLECGYYQTSYEKSVGDSYSGISYNSKVNFIPIVLNIYHYNRITPKSFVLIGAGLGYYKSEIDIHRNLNYASSNELSEYESRTYSGSAIGVNLKFEYNYYFSKGSRWIIGTTFRYAEVSKYKSGDDVLVDSNGNNVTASLTGTEIYFGVGFDL